MSVYLTKPEIVKITFNFVQYNDGTEAGETFELAEVGKVYPFGKKKDLETGKQIDDNRRVKLIKQASSYYIIYFENMSFIRIYNPNMVYYENRLES